MMITSKDLHIFIHLCSPQDNTHTLLFKGIHNYIVNIVFTLAFSTRLNLHGTFTHFLICTYFDTSLLMYFSTTFTIPLYYIYNTLRYISMVHSNISHIHGSHP